jgi:ribonuclease BN (tRNA processing enzyme)
LSLPFTPDLPGQETSLRGIRRQNNCIQTSPVRHVVPTLAVKIVVKLSGASVVYSADTAPWQAGKLAQWCDVKRLGLVHLGVSLAEAPRRALDEVREHFKGEVEIAEDLSVYELS